MRSWVLAAGLLAAAVTTGAQAADLDEGPPPDRYGSAYDDPRYADIYKYPGGRRPTACRRPVPTAVHTPARTRVRRPMPGHRSRASASIARRRTTIAATLPARGAIPTPSRARPTPGAARRASWSRSGCTAKAGATSTMAMRAANIATVHARRPSGRLFVLTLDRCSGEVVRAEPLEGRPFGPYAYGGPQPRRWDRAY